MKSQTPLRRISLNIPSSVDTALDKESARQSRTRTAIIVIALLHYFRAIRQQNLNQKNGKLH